MVSVSVSLIYIELKSVEGGDAMPITGSSHNNYMFGEDEELRLAEAASAYNDYS